MKFRLKLYVTGQTSNSVRAIRNLEALCEREPLAGSYELEVIDVLEQPNLAEEHNILATPTLVREFPEPIRKVIGDLGDQEKVLLGLDLVRENSAPSGASPQSEAQREES